MILAGMQPYFFPYLGYFDLINRASHWIVFDTPQYIRHGWVNRNRILHPAGNWQYILAPIQGHSRETPIKDILVIEGDSWKKRILGQIQHYRKRAGSRFTAVEQLVEDSLATDTCSLTEINVRALAKVCAFLDISFEPQLYSEMELRIGPVECSGDWALRIAEAMGADELVNPPGGEPLLDRPAFERLGIKLTITHMLPMLYDCPGYTFEPSLSIIDVLMWNDPGEVKRYLDAQRDT